MRVTKRVISSHRHYPNSRRNPQADAPASMVGDFKDIDSIRDQDLPLDIPSQKGRSVRSLQEKHYRVVVLGGFPNPPVWWGVQDLGLADGLACGNPADRDLLLLEAFDQLAVWGSHWITSQPEFSHFEVLDHVSQSVHMIMMSMG